MAQIMDRLLAAMNAHDLDAFVACFAPDYASQQPAHPRHPRRSRRRELRRRASQGPTPPLFPTAAQPRRPQPGSRLAQPPEGLGLDPGEDDDTIPRR